MYLRQLLTYRQVSFEMVERMIKETGHFNGLARNHNRVFSVETAGLSTGGSPEEVIAAVREHIHLQSDGALEDITYWVQDMEGTKEGDFHSGSLD